MNFEEIQKSWQLQQAPQLIDKQEGKALEVGIKDRVKAIQRKVIWTNVLMTIVVLLTAAAFVFIFRKVFPPKTPWFDAGLFLLFGAALLSAGAQWMKSIPWRNRRADYGSSEYIRRTLKSLRFQNISIRLLTPLQMVVSAIGLNLVYVDIFWDESWKLRLVMHIGLIAVMILVGGLSLYYSRLRYQDQYEPIIQELEELQQKLNEV